MVKNYFSAGEKVMFRSGTVERAEQVEQTIMKRCPECRRDYYDDTLLYCLDDGNALLKGRCHIISSLPFLQTQSGHRSLRVEAGNRLIPG